MALVFSFSAACELLMMLFELGCEAQIRRTSTTRLSVVMPLRSLLNHMSSVTASSMVDNLFQIGHVRLTVSQSVMTGVVGQHMKLHMYVAFLLRL